MFQKILIAFDGSDHARRAARIAGDMARMIPNAELHLVCAMEPMPTELGNPYIEDMITERTRAGELMLEQARKIIGDDVSVHSELLFGTPAESILEVAKTQDCDLIIMGTRGLGGLKGLLLGSQIQKVISLSEIPVLSVK